MTLNYELRHHQHAIGEFVTLVKLVRPVSPAAFSGVTEKLKIIANRLDLPALMPIQVVNIALGQSSPVTSMPSAIGFQRFAKDGRPEVAIVCDQDSINFTATVYPGWREIEPIITRVFSELLPAYLPEASAIHSIRLQYLNEFRESSPHSGSASEIFRKDSKWVAPFALQSDDYWHCHIGHFSPFDGSMRQLINVNCDVLDAQFSPGESQMKYVKVLLLAGSFFDHPDHGGLVIPADSVPDVIHKILNNTHALERQTLKEIIADPYLERMGALVDDY